MKYHMHRTKNTPKITVGIVIVLIIFAVALFGVTQAVRYRQGLRPAASQGETVTLTIAAGDSVQAIGTQLKKAGLIRDTTVFAWYAQIHKVSRFLQAGTYELSPTQSTQEIVAQLTHGKVATKLITILPGKRLDQIRQSFIKQGFSETAVDAALAPGQYESSPIFASKPVGNNLEGFLYPESYQLTASATPSSLVQQSIRQLQKQLTPDIVQGFARQGLSVYQGLIMASVVEQEVINQSDRTQAAQVFLKRLKIGMPLGSDVTAFYGSVLAGRGKDVTYDTPYNTRIHTGLPPTPISNVSKSSLEAVARPASTDWLFFVSGDNGTTYFSKTVEEHEALAAKYCHKLCE